MHSKIKHKSISKVIFFMLLILILSLGYLFLVFLSHGRLKSNFHLLQDGLSMEKRYQ
jgi:hypothetical protein